MLSKVARFLRVFLHLRKHFPVTLVEKKFKAPFVFSVFLLKNHYLESPNSDFDSSWKDLLAYNNINTICTLIHLFSNETYYFSPEEKRLRP